MSPISRGFCLSIRKVAAPALVTAAWIGSLSPAFAQGQDGTRAERDAQIIGSLLPGRYDNVNQVYFDRRLGEDESTRVARTHVVISHAPERDLLIFELKKIDADGDAASEIKFASSLSPSPDGRSVLMRFHEFDGEKTIHLPRCDLIWKREANQFRAFRNDGRCEAQSPMLPLAFQLGPNDLWWSISDSKSRSLALERARDFACYIDVPGVGGGRDIPYRRYEIPAIHDKGGKSWVTLEDGTELSVRLTNVRWPINNLDGIFTRHSFVVYLGDRANGMEREIAYSWTHPDAQRIGLNVKTALVNCFMLSNEEIEPFFDEEPRL